jgi:preprotein translocase subunit SecB
MSENDAGAPAQANGQPPEVPGIRILAQYAKDFSFENPRAPDSLRIGQVQPQIDLGVEMNAKGREDGLFEVDLKLSARAEREDGPLFVVELVYGGLFQIVGVPSDDIEPVLLIECPRFLFPYARRLIADVTGEGGYPPFHLEPIDFGAVYAARKAQQAEALGGAGVGNA